MDCTFQGDTSDLSRSLRAMAEVTHKAFPDVIRTAGRTLSRELATETYPLGSGAVARKAGQLAISSDIRKVYATPATVFEAVLDFAKFRRGRGGTPEQFANALAKALETNNLPLAHKLLQSDRLDQRGGWKDMKIGVFDGGAEHQRRRSTETGRVKGDIPSFIVTKKGGALKTYISAQQKLAGMAKSAWAATSALLGSTSGFPAWITKKMEGKGSVVNNLRDADPSVMLKANLQYESHALPPQGIARAQRFAAQKLEKMSRIIIEKACADFNHRSY
jgi:hypothetical protein